MNPLIFIILFSGVLAGAARADEITLENWSSHALDAWSDYLTSLEPLKGEAIFRHTAKMDEKELPEWESNQLFSLIQGHSRRSIRVIKGELGGTNSSYVSNPLYFFEVESKEVEPNWAIRNYNESKDADSPNPLNKSDARVSALHLISQQFWVRGFHIPSAVNDPGFKSEHIETLNLDGTRYIRLKFSLNTNNNKLHFIKSGTIDLMPDNFWLPQYGEFALEFKQYDKKKGQYFVYETGTGKLTCSYQFSDSRVPLLTKHDFLIKAESVTGRKQFMESHELHTFQYQSPVDFNMNDYYLSDFGLPEPNLPPKYSSFWFYLLIFLGGATLLGLGIYYRRKSRA